MPVYTAEHFVALHHVLHADVCKAADVCSLAFCNPENFQGGRKCFAQHAPARPIFMFHLQPFHVPEAPTGKLPVLVYYFLCCLTRPPYGRHGSAYLYCLHNVKLSAMALLLSYVHHCCLPCSCSLHGICTSWLSCAVVMQSLPAWLTAVQGRHVW